MLVPTRHTGDPHVSLPNAAVAILIHQGPVLCLHPLCCRLLHPDSPAHEGYAVVPPVLLQLSSLKQVELHVNSGQNAELEAAAAVPDVQLVLTLARHEQVPFSR